MEKQTIKSNFDIEPHPNKIFGFKVDTSKTEGGVIKPESVEDRTPLMEIVAVGKNIDLEFKKGPLAKGDQVMVIPQYLNFIELRGQVYAEIMPDAILGIKNK